MLLSSRKLKILEAIIKSYVETAEPVGSRKISRIYNFEVSPATIRNEMADLEELGFLIQPHTSAGRIPTQKGYRLYVDQLMKYKDVGNEKNEIDKKVEILKRKAMEKDVENDFVIKEIAKIVMSITSYPVIVSTSKIKELELKHLELVPVDERTVVLLVVSKDDEIRNFSLKTRTKIEAEEIRKISKMLNQHLKGLKITDINYPLIQTLKSMMGNYKGMLEPVLELVSKMIDFKDETKIYVNKKDSILEFPEYNDLIKAKKMFHTLEEKEKLKSIIKRNSKPGINVAIGKEIKVDEMKDCSLITATYANYNNVLGTIGVIGPTRMDYSKLVSLFAYITKRMSGTMQKLIGG